MPGLTSGSLLEIRHLFLALLPIGLVKVRLSIMMGDVPAVSTP